MTDQATTDNPVLRVAAKAIIVNDGGKVLVLREADTYEEGTNIGRWGIPGGRINIGESYFDGLRREAKEESGLEVEPLYPVSVGEWRPVIKGVPHQIIALFTACKAKPGKIKLSEEHDKYLWIGLEDMDDLDLMEREPIEKFFATQKA